MAQLQLDRITGSSDYVDGKQAYIRDTGLTVSQLVLEIMQGKAVSELLSEHPDLVNEDIQQVLIYAIKDMGKSILIHRSDGLGPLVTIRGYTELLQLRDSSEEEQQEFLKRIHQQTDRAIAIWNELMEWVHTTYLGR